MLATEKPGFAQSQIQNVDQHETDDEEDRNDDQEGLRYRPIDVAPVVPERIPKALLK